MLFSRFSLVFMEFHQQQEPSKIVFGFPSPGGRTFVTFMSNVPNHLCKGCLHVLSLHSLSMNTFQRSRFIYQLDYTDLPKLLCARKENVCRWE